MNAAIASRLGAVPLLVPLMGKPLNNLISLWKDGVNITCFEGQQARLLFHFSYLRV